LGRSSGGTPWDSSGINKALVITMPFRLEKVS